MIVQEHLPVVSLVVSFGQVWSSESEPASGPKVHRAPATGAPADDALALTSIP
jgi:hypothetical protein